MINNDLDEIMRKIRDQMLTTAFEVNMAGSWVGMNAEGKVEMRALSSGELLSLKGKYPNFENLPKEYTVYTEKDLPKYDTNEQ